MNETVRILGGKTKMQKGTITRRMDNVFDGLQSEFRSLCDIEDFKAKLLALKKSEGRSDRSSKLRILFDMFDACSIEYERGKDYEYYENLVMNSNIPKFSEIEDRMMLSLYNKYSDYPTPEEYIKRIVDRLSCDEDDWDSDTLRVRILKQFIKYGNCLTYVASRGGQKETINIYCGGAYIKKYMTHKNEDKNITIAKLIDGLHLLKDDIFDVLLTATKAQKKPSGTYGILKMVDDLASGKFRTGGATKKSLYLFAMVYGMTFYSSTSDIIDYKTDIETNLFRDYYNNNLMRFITTAYRGKLCEYDLDPSGQGINYKNFAEMVYLYYISKDCSPEEKIKSSNEMIFRIQTESFNKGAKNVAQTENQTMYYKGLVKNLDKNIYCEDILSKDEAAFEEFIYENYNCDTHADSHSVGELQLETEQHTAHMEYLTILKDLIDLGMDLSHCNYGLWFTDVAAFKKKGYKNICDRRTDIDKEKFEEFIELLLGINSFMGHTVNEDVSEKTTESECSTPSKIKTKALYVDSPSDITRTSMIVAYYYYYNALHENDGREKWKNFEELFNDFKKGIDEKLEASYYHPLSGKNIFDVLVAFSSYAYLNI